MPLLAPDFNIILFGIRYAPAYFHRLSFSLSRARYSAPLRLTRYRRGLGTLLRSSSASIAFPSRSAFGTPFLLTHNLHVQTTETRFFSIIFLFRI